MLKKTAARVGDMLIYYTDENGKYIEWKPGDIAWWTNGFWAGKLWLLYRDSDDVRIRSTV